MINLTADNPIFLITVSPVHFLNVLGVLFPPFHFQQFFGIFRYFLPYLCLLRFFVFSLFLSFLKLLKILLRFL